MTAWRVRRLAPADAEQLVRLRRQALALEPLAFGASPADDLAGDVGFVRRALADGPDRVCFGAFAPNLAGMVGLNRRATAKARHKADLWGFYVAAGHRGGGLGRRLLERALEHARAQPGLARVLLSVSETAPGARRLYERLGFEVWGTEADALRHGGNAVAEHHMVLRL